MTRGPAPIVPRGYALRICLGKYTALAVALGREYVVGFFGVMMRDRSAGLGTGVVTAKYYTICIIQ